ncbi:MAG: M20 family metallopeptidase [Lachnospiraceae bacterium]|nr:M20 family metallopeptidase [Lachnospiraceae bacterium]
MNTMDLIKKYESGMIDIRRHIHANPELSNEEFKTTELIREKLTEYGIEICEIGMKTGVVGLLKGGKPGKTVAIREDIDALPMSELTGLPFASKVENVCHSCGHDIHTTTLLFCAKVLSELREELCGNVLFLFQPAEERGSGAKQLVECKFYEVSRPDVFVGLHVSPEYPAGSIGLKRGPANASCDTFYIKVSGKGGHGAHPENCIDPIAISGYVLAQLQTVISRENHPVYPAVMTIGSIHGGKAANVIPDFVEMSGTLRSLNADSRAKMQEAIERITKASAEAMRGHAEVTWEKGMPPLVNDVEVIEDLQAAAEKTIGADHVITVQNPSLGSEDFSYLFPEYAPGAQFRLGSGNDIDPNTRHGLHNSRNVFDDSCLAAGTAVLVQYVRDFLR